MKARAILVPFAVAAAFAAGLMLAPDAAPAEQGLWSCPMHPRFTSPGPGKCGICGMDLVRSDAAPDPGPRRLVMSEAAKELAEVATVPVERRLVTVEVRMVGKVTYDETRVKTISAWVPGRLDRLFVDYTGVAVRKGDHLVWLYSPDLLTAQIELLEAKKAVERGAEEPSAFLRQSDLRRLASAREKLRLFGLTSEQVAEIEARGSAEDHVMITSPTAGIVVMKGVNEGDYVETGTKIYEIADLDEVWVKLDAYEADLPWIRYGQPVRVEAEAYPGEVFEGSISFVDPVLDERTRTVKVRVNVDNRDRRLKPGMFVRGVVHAHVASGGRVMDPQLEGKYVCPMHPEVVRGEAGDCPVCGMALMPAEELGYVRIGEQAEKPLVVPASAVLVTGRRGVVYVEVPGTEHPTYEGREVVLGPRGGDEYVVLAGLAEGERVVVHGNFKIDSALQIQAKRSMMSMPADSGLEPADVAAMRRALAPLYDAYFRAHSSLASDDAEAARAAIADAAAAAAGLEGAVPSPVADTWARVHAAVAEAGRAARAADDLPELRAAFRGLSAGMVAAERAFGHAESELHAEVHCPMVFESGASWLQRGEGVRNPYDTSMPGCGTVVERFAPQEH